MSMDGTFRDGTSITTIMSNSGQHGLSNAGYHSGISSNGVISGEGNTGLRCMANIGGTATQNAASQMEGFKSGRPELCANSWIQLAQATTILERTGLTPAIEGGPTHRGGANITQPTQFPVR